jgi:hypothetical protein
LSFRPEIEAYFIISSRSARLLFKLLSQQFNNI